MPAKMNIPGDVQEMIENIAKEKKISGEEVLRRVVKSYARRRADKTALKKGYIEMGEINLGLAEICFDADSTQLESYEEKLAECE